MTRFYARPREQGCVKNGQKKIQSIFHHERNMTIWILFWICCFISCCDNFLKFGDPWTRCYGKYGCLDLKYPWYSSHRVVNLFPKSAQEIEVNFYIYTWRNKRQRQELFTDDEASVQKSNFDSNKT